MGSLNIWLQVLRIWARGSGTTAWHHHPSPPNVLHWVSSWRSTRLCCSRGGQDLQALGFIRFSPCSKATFARLCRRSNAGVLLSWSNGAPSFPERLLSKFAEGTQSHLEVAAMKKELLQEFPDSCRRPAASEQPGGGRTAARATGRPDYSIDGGQQPLDTARLIDKEHIPTSAFTATRLGFNNSKVLWKCVFFWL